MRDLFVARHCLPTRAAANNSRYGYRIRSEACRFILAAIFLSAALVGCHGELAQGEIVRGVTLEDSNNWLEEARVSIGNCKIMMLVSSSIECVVTYSGPTGQIVPNFFGAVAYDGGGVRLGIASFPDQHVPPNQPVRSTLHFPVPVRDINKVIIAVNVGNGFVESR